MREAESDDPPVHERRVCGGCVHEAYLANLIDSTGAAEQCDYCCDQRTTISIDELSDHVKRVIDQHYKRTSTDPEGYEYYLQKLGKWVRAGETIKNVIWELLKTSETVAEEVRQALDERTSDFDSVASGEEQPYDEDAQYEEISEIDHTTLSAEYRKFERLVIEQARYFSQQTRRYLHELFDGLNGLRTRDGRSILVEAGPGQSVSGFFRARVFQDSESLRRALATPDRELGPPPPRTGRAGRLNAAGVSIFYGSDVAAVALSEVRPPVGSRVVVARFELLRPVLLADIDALNSLLVDGSLFDPMQMNRLQRAAFLKSFSRRFTQPIMPDHESFEYIPTQAIADYLANEVDPRLDGLIYSSTQSGDAGRNIALFYSASRVEPTVRPHGMTCDVGFGHQTEDGYEIDYNVYEKVSGDAIPMADLPDPREGQAPDEDERPPSLRILDSLTVHHINAVEVRSDSHRVHRTRDTSGQSEF